VSPFEEAVSAALADLLRAGVPVRTLRLITRELVVARLERGSLGPGEVRDAVAAAVRAACRLVREAGAPDDVVELVCRAALEAVRGHGGTTAQWLSEARGAVERVLDEAAWERAGESEWRWLVRSLERW
jgi:hypothetical protein